MNSQAMHQPQEPEAIESTLQFLKRTTQPVHTTLEATPVATRIMAENVSQADVLTFMQANYACLAGLETVVVTELGAAIAEHGYSLQAPVLEQDFHRLGVPLPAVHTAEFGSNLTHALGGLYVLMGSQFGKAIIRRHLMRQALDVGTLGFFEVPDELANRWRRFGQQLDSGCLERDQLAQGAADFFAHFLVQWDGRQASTPTMHNI